MKKIFTYDRGFTVFCLVVAILFALAAIAVSGGSFSVFKAFGAVFFGIGSLAYLFLAFVFARPKPPRLA